MTALRIHRLPSRAADRRSDVEPSFRREPLRYLDHRLESADESFWIHRALLCVAEPEAAKAVLANRGRAFREHSDFFHTTRGAFGPRLLQVVLARGGRQLLSAHAAARAHRLPDTVDRVVRSTSEWPDAGNRLLYEHFKPTLVTPERAELLEPLLEQVLEKAVFAGARERRSRIVRALFRRRLFRALRREIEHRIAAPPPGESRDLFDVLAAVAGPEANESGIRPSDLGQLYLPFFFAVTSSIGFTVGWALHLLASADDDAVDAPSEWIVREALRLWPIAWQMARFPARSHRLAGEQVTPDTTVLISPYVTHRHPAYWSEPTRFLPERWARPSACTAYLPFGWGPHTCAAAALSLEVARDIVDLLRHRRLSTTHHTQQPFTGPSLAPPRFRLDLSPTPTIRVSQRR
ncbi:MAG: cytochrome P450 [Acidobacteriota bacterium]